MPRVKTTVMRENADGSGYSPCKADEENIGKKRCHHLPNGKTFTVKIEKQGDLKEITFSKEVDDLDDVDKIDVIKSFISTMKPVTRKNLDKALKELRSE